MLKRKVYDRLLEWKRESNGASAILLEGARRVGKSTIVKEFAKSEYEKFLIIDFSTASMEVKKNFENIDDLDTFFRNLFVLTGVELKTRKSLIVFDEVQFFPLARQAIKQLVNDGRFDYIETGSLISIKKNVNNILIPSEEENLKMYPLDFEEFLWAVDKGFYADVIWDSFNNKKALGDSIHRKIMQIFRTYMAVGGMPQAVKAFVEGKTYRQIDRIKQNIISLYINDLKKHDAGEDNATVVFKSLPQQLMNHNSKFHFSIVDKNARERNTKNAIEFLVESMIVNNSYNITNPEIVFELYKDNKNFKMFMGDTGLLISYILQSGKESIDDLYKSLIFNELSINQGMIFENMVSQMLKANGHDLYFHEFGYSLNDSNSKKKYEIDFMLVKEKTVCPIEVKSSNYKNHKSFDIFDLKYQIKTKEKYIIYSKDLLNKDNILFIPIYMTMCL